jgi:drug/metabolite transporter (DMT)-like permease
MFGERIARRDIVLAAVALAAVFVVVIAGSGSSEWSLAGDLLAVLSTLVWGGVLRLLEEGSN